MAEVPTAQAISGADSSAWQKAMASEVRSLIENNIWEIIDRPIDKRIIGSRFVLRNKYDSSGAVERRKARVVARGFSQRPGVDFRETFAPVARLSSIRAAIATAVQRDMKIEQLDIATAYLNGKIEDEIFMEPPEYFEDILEYITRRKRESSCIRKAAERMLDKLNDGDVVCRLNKALYGLRQAGRAWHSTLDQKLHGAGAIPSTADPCVYHVKGDKGESIIIAYVDDILIMSREDEEIKRLKSHLSVRFEVKDLGTVKRCLGLEFSRKKDAVTISQKGYLLDVLNKFGMSECRPVATPMEPGVKLSANGSTEDESKGTSVPYRELIGGLMYLPVGTRPDIAHAVSRLSQFNDCHTKTHWEAAKRVMRYLKGTSDLGLVYRRSDAVPAIYADADWSGCSIDRKSYTGYVSVIGGDAASWESKKQ